MIAKLRQRHTWMSGTMAMVAPLVVVAALISREPPPPPVDLSLGKETRFAESMTGTKTTLFSEDLPVNVGWSRSGEESVLVIEPSRDLIGPKLLVYWQGSQISLPAGKMGEAQLELDTTAIYLGHYKQTEPTVIGLPESFTGGDGQLVLYSLVTKEIVAVSNPMRPSF
jgi:hypothetical protein